MTRTRVWAGATLFCWLVSMYLAVAPVEVNYGDFRPSNPERCRNPIAAALGESGAACADESRDRVGHLVQWLILTGAVSTFYVASAARRRPEPAE